MHVCTAGIELYERLLAKRRRHKTEQKEAMRKDLLAEVSLETRSLIWEFVLAIYQNPYQSNCYCSNSAVSL